jgi:aspartate 1-decarboxylase
MQITVLKSKIHRATVTDADLDYQGSISIDPELCRAARLHPYERVDVYNCNNGERFSTYVIVGGPGAAGAAGRPGDHRVLRPDRRGPSRRIPAHAGVRR